MPGPVDIVLEFDNASNSLTDVTANILTIDDISVEAALEETSAFGSAWKTSAFTGVKMMANFSLGGNYNATVNTIFNALGATRTFKITYLTGYTSSVETIIKNYKRSPGRGLTKFKVELEPTGAVTEVTP